jgi:hypothetical protein
VLVVVKCRICRGREVPLLAGIERQAMQQVSESYRKWLARGVLTCEAGERSPFTHIKGQFLLVSVFPRSSAPLSRKMARCLKTSPTLDDGV